MALTEHQKLIQKRYRETHKTEKRERWRRWSLKNKAYLRARDRMRHALLWNQLYDIYGTRCVRCGFNDLACLQLDHINGEGHKERRRVGGMGVLRRAVLHSDEYQLLCANCNWRKRVENNEYSQKYKDVQCLP